MMLKTWLTNILKVSPSALLSFRKAWHMPTLAGLPPQFGLYSSFMGVLIYWIFATSKDITIGVRAPVHLTFPEADHVNSL